MMHASEERAPLDGPSRRDGGRSGARRRAAKSTATPASAALPRREAQLAQPAERDARPRDGQRHGHRERRIGERFDHRLAIYCTVRTTRRGARTSRRARKFPGNAPPRRDLGDARVDAFIVRARSREGGAIHPSRPSAREPLDALRPSNARLVALAFARPSRLARRERREEPRRRVRNGVEPPSRTPARRPRAASRARSPCGRIATPRRGISSGVVGGSK